MVHHTLPSYDSQSTRRSPSGMPRTLPYGIVHHVRHRRRSGPRPSHHRGAMSGTALRRVSVQRETGYCVLRRGITHPLSSIVETRYQGRRRVSDLGPLPGRGTRLAHVRYPCFYFVFFFLLLLLPFFIAFLTCCVGCLLLVLLFGLLLVACLSGCCLCSPDMVTSRSKRILFNRELVGNIDPRRHAARDVFHGGDCDASIEWLAKCLGWWPQLQSMHGDVVRKIIAQKK